MEFKGVNEVRGKFPMQRLPHFVSGAAKMWQTLGANPGLRVSDLFREGER